MAKALSATIILAAFAYSVCSEAAEVEVCKYMTNTYTGKHQYFNQGVCTQVLHGSAVASSESPQPVAFVLTVACVSDSCGECDGDPVKFYGQCNQGSLTGYMFDGALFNMTGVFVGPLDGISLVIDAGGHIDSHYERDWWAWSMVRRRRFWIDDIERQTANPSSSDMSAGVTGSGRSMGQRQVQGSKITPNLISFNTVLAACEKSGRWISAQQVLRQMNENALPPDRRSWTSLVACFSRGSKWMEAHGTIQELRQMRLQQDMMIIGAAASAYQRGHQWLFAMEVFSQVLSLNLQPDEQLYSSVIAASAMALQWETAMSLLQSMPARRLQTTSASCAPVLTALLEAKHWMKALELFNEPGLAKDTQMYSRMVMVCEQHNLVELKQPLLESLVHDLAASADQQSLTTLVAGRSVSRRPGARARDVPLSGSVPWRPYAKEIRLMEHILETAVQGDPASVCDAFESFGLNMSGTSKAWLKLAAGEKAQVLVAAACCAPAGLMLEIGTYCGHSAIRLAAARPDSRVVTLEVDPVHAIIARALVEFAGLSSSVQVWTGYSRDLIPFLANRYRDSKGTFGFVFMDQRGSRYEEDLASLQRLSLLREEAVVVADNVLKPGAPRYLWQVCRSGAFDTEVVRVFEFAMPVEDWMSVSVVRGGTTAATAAFATPSELEELSQVADEMRNRAQTSGGVSFTDWSSFAEKMQLA
ncbi:unnamed protein product [Durusdinium trenchii]|uniref:catechol O-methyltransferase n=1 Tax=Durusdinium trenchii TaxID=1381693 RepID=A0ABP0T014_9DINO